MDKIVLEYMNKLINDNIMMLSLSIQQRRVIGFDDIVYDESVRDIIADTYIRATMATFNYLDNVNYKMSQRRISEVLDVNISKTILDLDLELIRETQNIEGKTICVSDLVPKLSNMVNESIDLSKACIISIAQTVMSMMFCKFMKDKVEA